MTKTARLRVSNRS